MKSYESQYNPAVKKLSDFIIKQAHDGRIQPDILGKITPVLEGIEVTDKLLLQKDSVINQKTVELQGKDNLLAQKEKELVRLKSITDNSSKVARDVVQESKVNLEKAVSLHKSGKFSEALEYSNKALYSIGDIDSFGVKTATQANKLYLERLELYKDSASKRDNLYNSSVVNGVNAFSWVKDNPTRDFYTFFRETLNISDKEQKSPDNVRIIKKLYDLLPLYVEEAQKTNYFYNEYNKYYDAKIKLEQVANIYNIKAASSKGLKDYAEALKSCDQALTIDPSSTTIVNLKNAILEEKQVVKASRLEEKQEIAILKALLAQKELEKEELKALLVQEKQEREIEKQQLLAQKEAELHDKSFAKNEIIEDLAETVALKDGRINDLQLLNEELSHIPVGIQMGGIEEASQTTGVALIGDDVDIVLFH